MATRGEIKGREFSRGEGIDFARDQRPAGRSPRAAASPRSWTVLTASAVSSISLSSLTLDTSGFTAAYTGAFSLAESGNSLLVTYTAGAIPEPATYALLAGAGIFAFAFWRRRRARS